MSLHDNMAALYLKTYQTARSGGLGKVASKAAANDAVHAHYPIIREWRKAYRGKVRDENGDLAIGARAGRAKDYNTYMGKIGPGVKAIENTERANKEVVKLAASFELWLEDTDNLPGEGFFGAFTNLDSSVVQGAFCELEDQGYTLEPTDTGYRVTSRPVKERDLTDVVADLVANGDTETLVNIIEGLVS
jgi:hypothetical protein